MPILVHIADARDARKIERSGIVPSRWRQPERRGVYAMPVLPSYFVSHQWVRELKRRGLRTMIGIYFRVPDREAVLVGHYGRQHTPMSASRAVRVIMEAADARGYEILLPRKIEAKELHAIRPVNRVVGWRFYPDAHGKQVCGCPACSKGVIKSRRLREAYEAAFRE
jgi:hypothetical protein